MEMQRSMLKNMKIGKRLILTFTAAVLISAISGISGLIEMNRMDKSYGEALTMYGFSQGDVGIFNTEFNNSQTVIRDVINAGDENRRKMSLNQMATSIAKTNMYFAAIKGSMVTSEELYYYNDIKGNLDSFNQIKDQIVSLADKKDKTGAEKLLTDQLGPVAEKIQASTAALLTEKSTAGKQISQELEEEGLRTSLLMILIILGSLVFSLLIARSTSRKISGPVNEMSGASLKMAKGSLDVRVNGSSIKEIKQLGDSINQSAESIRAYIADITNLLDEVKDGNLCADSSLEYIGDYAELKNAYEGIVFSLNDALSRINRASEQVSTGAGRVSRGSQILSQGAAQQASSIEELSAAVSDISEHAKDNASYAAEAGSKVRSVQSDLELSDKSMGEMVAAMSQINGSSLEIGKINKTIDEIAFQTNILALNAAVEAARAGSAGKGFAVVADEVRNLAGKSAQAAKDTSKLIENSLEQVRNGAKIADETAGALRKVVTSTQSVLNAVGRISKASDHQSEAINQVRMGLDQITGVVQTNSSTAAESAAASRELFLQSQNLKELVDRFKLKPLNEELTAETEATL